MRPTKKLAKPRKQSRAQSLHTTIHTRKLVADNIQAFLVNFANCKCTIACDFTPASYEERIPYQDTAIQLFNFLSKTLTQIKIKWHNNKRNDLASITIVNMTLYAVFCDYDFTYITCAPTDLAFTKLSLSNHKIIDLSNFIVSKGGRAMCKFKNQYIASLCGFSPSGFVQEEDTCEKYSIELNKWTMLPKASQGKCAVGAIEIGNFIYMIGGVYKDMFLNTIEKLPILDGKNWISCRLTNTKTPMGYILNVINTQDGNILVLGKNDETTYCTQISIKDNKCVEHTALKCNASYALKEKDTIKLIGEDGIYDYSIHGKLLHSNTIQGETSNWKKLHIEITSTCWEIKNKY